MKGKRTDIFDWMVKLGCIKKCNLVENRKTILAESQESKSINAAKKLVMQKLGYDAQRADEFVRIQLRGDFPVLRDKNAGKFILGVTRMFCDGQITNARTIRQLNNTLKYVASNAHINEYDRNLNDLSATALIGRFASAATADQQKGRNESTQARSLLQRCERLHTGQR